MADEHDVLGRLAAVVGVGERVHGLDREGGAHLVDGVRTLLARLDDARLAEVVDDEPVRVLRVDGGEALGRNRPQVLVVGRVGLVEGGPLVGHEEEAALAALVLLREDALRLRAHAVEQRVRVEQRRLSEALVHVLQLELGARVEARRAVLGHDVARLHAHAHALIGLRAQLLDVIVVVLLAPLRPSELHPVVAREAVLAGDLEDEARRGRALPLLHDPVDEHRVLR